MPNPPFNITDLVQTPEERDALYRKRIGQGNVVATPEDMANKYSEQQKTNEEARRRALNQPTNQQTKP